MRIGLKERLARIETAARKLARSGQYAGAYAVEMALLTRGYSEAHTVFANRWSVAELDRLCDQARLRLRIEPDDRAA
jgi:hypothetical protein